MDLTIGAGLERAWDEGAKAVGIRPDEYTQDELAARDTRILAETQYIGGFADFIEAGSKANGGKLGALAPRTQMWINRYNDMKNFAILVLGRNQKLKWRLGPTEEHCEDCSKYNGRVYRASTWARHNIRPQSRSLSCHGYNCKCRLEPTKDKATPGKPPGMTG